MTAGQECSASSCLLVTYRLLNRKGGTRMKGELNRTVMIYIDSCMDGIISGRYHVASNQEAQPFHGLCQLLLGINENLDRENFPQSFAELRKFQKPSRLTSSSPLQMNQKRGSVATFSVRILFRQNASWQGSVSWIEGNQEEYFRSVLELIVLLDNAIAYAQKK